jgi:acetyltransferase-like isoleucine patch superfamily enzyme
MSLYTGCRLNVNPGASLTLGSGYINCGTSIDCFKEIKIGHDVAISQDCCLRDSDNHEIEGGDPASAAITIGNHVWLGLKVTVLKGVTIGDGAVVAANSLVNKDVPARTLVGGIPARVLKENISWS